MQRLLVTIAIMTTVCTLGGCHSKPDTAYETLFRVEDTETNRIVTVSCIETIARRFGFKKYNGYSSNELVTYELDLCALRVWPEEADATLFTNDIIDLESLANKIRNPSVADRISWYFHDNLSTNTLRLLSSYKGDKDSKLLQALRDDLSSILILKGPLYEVERFRNVALSPRTVAMMNRELKGGDIYRLNRLLLDDAYHSEIRPMEKDPLIVAVREFAPNMTMRFRELEGNLTKEIEERFGNNYKVTTYRCRL